MKLSNSIRALLTGATLTGLVSQASVVSATTECSATWPEYFAYCSSDNSADSEYSTGGGFNVTNPGGNRQVSANFRQGSVSAIARALSSNGQIVCEVTDTNKATNATANKFCQVAAQPVAIVLIVD